MDNMTITQEMGQRPVTVYHIRGEISSHNYQDLEKQAKDSYAGGMRDLLLDFKEVPYISSAGIRALNTIIKMLRTDAPEESDAAMSQGLRDGTFHSPHLKLVNVSKNVAEVLRIAGMDMLVEMHPDMKSALKSF